MSGGPSVSSFRMLSLLAYWAVSAITIFFEPLRALALECWRIALLAPLRAVREGWGGLKAQWAPDRHEAHRRSLAAARGI